MVLQQGGKGATLWGYAPPGDAVTLRFADASGGRPVADTRVEAGDDGRWKAALPPQPPTPAGTEHAVTATGSSGGTAVLHGVVFGDVWVCSGQSNMDHPVTSVINASEEIAAANAIGGAVRLMMVKKVMSVDPTVELDELLALETRWSRASNVTVSNFSATCWLTGSIMQQHLGYPVGLIDSSWAGVAITPLSSLASCARCGVDARVPCPPNEYVPQNATSVYNTMIAPLHTTTVKGVLWWQGEASGAGCPAGRVNATAATYYCLWQSLIQDWRARWAARSNSGPSLPFGFVQLEPTANPAIRWDETAHRVSAPNACLPGVFMAAALDYGDTVAGVHTRYKRPIAARLALAARAVAYGEAGVYYTGPVAAEATALPNGDVSLRFASVGGAGIELRSAGGFSVCPVKHQDECYQWANDALFFNATARLAPPPGSSFDTVVLSVPPAVAALGGVGVVRYEWAALPCNWPTHEACAVYAKDGLDGLPAPPFMIGVGATTPLRPPPCLAPPPSA